MDIIGISTGFALGVIVATILMELYRVKPAEERMLRKMRDKIRKGFGIFNRKS